MTDKKDLSRVFIVDEAKEIDKELWESLREIIKGGCLGRIKIIPEVSMEKTVLISYAAFVDSGQGFGSNILKLDISEKKYEDWAHFLSTSKHVIANVEKVSPNDIIILNVIILPDWDEFTSPYGAVMKEVVNE